MAEHPGMRTIRRGAGGPVWIVCDVCVIGSGAAGLSAALEARALGKDVVLVDGAPQIGGQAVNSFIGTICGLYSNGPDPYRVTYGAMDGLLSDLFSAGAANARRARNTTIVDYSANAWMRWAERQVAEREITPLLGAVLRDVAREGERIVELSLATRWGDYAIRPRYVIDASGDAVVPWLADLPLNEADQEIYGTVMAVFENVDVAVSDTIPRGDYHEAMRRRGAEFGLIRFDGFIFSMAEEGKVLLNQTHIPTPQDAVGINRAMFEGRRQVDGLLALFREEFPQAFANALVATYGQTGIRQTRTITGQSRMTVEDVRDGVRPDDAIGRCSWPIELHTRVEDTSWEIFGEAHMHYMPYRAMVPQGMDNLVVAGRCIDAEPAALASVRVMGPCFSMGRAAAAAVDLVDGGSLRQIDLSALQATLDDNLEARRKDPWLRDIREEASARG